MQGLVPPSSAAASKASSLLSRADREFTNLRQKQSLQRKRHNYTRVEARYRKVYDGYPRTKEAEKALFHCGELYTLLYRWTSGRSDLNGAKTYYQRLLKDYPGSSLADDAQFEIANLYLNYYNDPVQAYREFSRVQEVNPRGDQVAEAGRWLKKLRRYRPSSAEPKAPPVRRTSSGAASSLLSRADEEFTKLKKTSSLQRYRHNYEKVLGRYRKVFDNHPGTPEAERALLRSGELYTLLYRWTESKSDLNRAKNYYQLLIGDYPGSSLSDDAQIAIAFLYLDQYKDPARAYREFQKVPRVGGDGNRKAEAERQLARLKHYKPREKPVRTATTTSPPPAHFRG